MIHACCVHALVAIAALALLLLVVVALLLSSLLLLSLLLRRLQCLKLSRLSRFPFHDSQVYHHTYRYDLALHYFRRPSVRRASSPPKHLN